MAGLQIQPHAMMRKKNNTALHQDCDSRLFKLGLNTGDIKTSTTAITKKILFAVVLIGTAKNETISKTGTQNGSTARILAFTKFNIRRDSLLILRWIALLVPRFVLAETLPC